MYPDIFKSCTIVYLDKTRSQHVLRKRTSCKIIYLDKPWENHVPRKRRAQSCTQITSWAITCPDNVTSTATLRKFLPSPMLKDWLKPHSCLYEKLELQEEDHCQAAELLPRLLLKSENYFYSGGKMKGGARRRGGLQRIRIIYDILHEALS